MDSIIRNIDKENISEILYEEIVDYYKKEFGASHPRQVAIAKKAAVNAAKKLEKASHGAFVYGLQDANKTGWHHLLPEEYDTVTEMLRDMLTEAEQEDHESEIYDLSFLVNDLIPVLEEHQVDPKLVFALPMSIAKTRAAVPILRKSLEIQQEAEKSVESLSEKKINLVRDIEFMKNSGIDDIRTKALEEQLENIEEDIEEAQKIAEEKKDQTIETIKKTLERIADQNISSRQFRRELSEISGVLPTKEEKAVGHHIILRGGDEAIVFIGNKKQMRAIEMMTRQVADTFIADPLGVINTLQDRYVKGSTSKRYAFVGGALVERDYGRIILPSEDSMIARTMNKIFEMKEVIEQFRRSVISGKLDIVIYPLPIASGERLIDHLRMLCNDYQTPAMELENNLSRAMLNLYSSCEKKMRDEISVIFPDVDMNVLAGSVYGKFGVYVTLHFGGL